MHLSQGDDYAVRALVDLAKHPESRIREIAERTSIPPAHLGKVIQALSRAGLVETARGRGGGVRLARNPGEISLRQALEAIQGPLGFCRCPRRERGCPQDPDCALYRLWLQVQEAITLRLESVRIADLMHSCTASGINTEFASIRALESTQNSV